jgi:hypothetical protein
MLKKPGELGRGDSITVQSASPRDSADWYTLVIAPGSGIASRDSVSFNPASAVADDGGNRAHAENRFVEVRHKEVAPALEHAWYTGNDATGRPDYAYIVFNKAVTEESLGQWFAGGKFEFDWATAAVTGTYEIKNVSAIAVMADNFPVPGLPEGKTRASVVRIDLSAAFSASQTVDPPATGGNIAMNVTFGHPDGWGRKPVSVLDKAAPVLTRAQLKIGTVTADNIEMPDTLVLTYSELLDENNVSSPVFIARRSQGGNAVSLDLTFRSRSISGNGHEVAYIVNALPDGIENGDSVWIDPDAGITDIPGNIQSNPQNRRVPLEVGAGSITWSVKIKNNPFRPGSGRDAMEIVLTPNAKGGKRDVRAHIKLYSNIGGMVIDTTIDNENQAGNDLEWKWSGRNKQGRMVGTGTYLFRAVCIVKGGGTNGADVRYDVQKPIGFVRGKN